MEEWKKDISASLSDKGLAELNNRIYDFGSAEYDKRNEKYKDAVFELFFNALKGFKDEMDFENIKDGFFLHLEVSDAWIDEKMLQRMSNIHPENRFLEYKEYVKSNNQY